MDIEVVFLSCLPKEPALQPADWDLIISLQDIPEAFEEQVGFFSPLIFKNILGNCRKFGTYIEE